MTIFLFVSWQDAVMVSHTSPYRHFSDKNELILAIARDVQDKFNTALRDALNSTDGTQTEKNSGDGAGVCSFFSGKSGFSGTSIPDAGAVGTVLRQNTITQAVRPWKPTSRL